MPRSTALARATMEFVGTYFLVLFIGLTVVPGHATAPLAIGLGLTALVYMGRPLSGAHYNPAVTVALWVHGSMHRPDLVPYLVAQFGGAMAATATVGVALGTTFALGPAPEASLAAVMAVEFVFTLLLLLVIFHVAVDEAVEGNDYYGLAIGLTIAAAAAAGGGISGGAYNPAVGIGSALVHGLAGHEWVYAVAPLAGGLAAIPLYQLSRRG